MTDQIVAYARTAERIRRAAPPAAPLLAGFNTCVDQRYHLTGDTLDALGALGPLGRELLARIGSGRDGEVFVPAPQLQSDLESVLGAPRQRQVGGTGPQAAWTLARVGAPSVVALADRSAAQLSVLDPDIGVMTGRARARVADVAPAGEPAKPPHYIVEYTAGTRWRGGTVPRSSRIIVRLACDGIERDDDFAALDPRGAGAGLVSGMNGIPDGDEESHRWLVRLVRSWRAAGLPLIHLELAEYAVPLPPVLDRYGPLVTSLGLSLAELRELQPGADPAAAALAVARRYRLDRVCVHADEWSLAVHRGDPADLVAALRTANLLAAARARHGAPTADLTVDPAATFTTDLPYRGPLTAGWRSDVVPTPYLARPAATIGLGDSFVAGLLLSACIPVANDGLDPRDLEMETNR
jgi:ADP-dependent phosphofructokinase/glucokinase